MHTRVHTLGPSTIMLEGLSNDLRGQMTPKVVHSSPDLPRPGQTTWGRRLAQVGLYTAEENGHYDWHADVETGEASSLSPTQPVC